MFNLQNNVVEMQIEITFIASNVNIFFSKSCLFNKLVFSFSPRLYLTGVNFRGELQHVGHVSEQKMKFGPIRNWEITNITLLDKLYANNIFFSKYFIKYQSRSISMGSSKNFFHQSPSQNLCEGWENFCNRIKMFLLNCRDSKSDQVVMEETLGMFSLL